MTIVSEYTPPCAQMPQDYAVDAPSPDVHRQCAGCPMLVDCLYRAVVEVDVSGFVACTTESDRAAIRRSLGIQVVDPTADLGFALARAAGSPVSHEAVLSARHAHPDDTCQQLAERLGCSTSTIKRHLRRARHEALAVVAVEVPPQRRVPSVDEVLDAFDLLDSSRVA
ncbi:MAG: HTH domain-containing protein [Aeromicrobium erythreum]